MPGEAQVKPKWSPMGPSGGKLVTECIPKSIDRSIPLPIACKCHFDATLDLQKASKSASVLDKSRLSTVATRHRGISERYAFSSRKTMLFTMLPWRSSIQFKQARTPKRSSISHRKQEAFVTPFWASFWLHLGSTLEPNSFKKECLND